MRQPDVINVASHNCDIRVKKKLRRKKRRRVNQATHAPQERILFAFFARYVCT